MHGALAKRRQAYEKLKEVADAALGAAVVLQLAPALEQARVVGYDSTCGGRGQESKQEVRKH